MSSDRELLELAAKAAGIHLDIPLYNNGSMYVVLRDEDGNALTAWNPLTDDGDALRLAWKLNISLSLVAGAKSVITDSSAGTLWQEGSSLASVRRAIVCAAAEIGRAIV